MMSKKKKYIQCFDIDSAILLQEIGYRLLDDQDLGGTTVYTFEYSPLIKFSKENGDKLKGKVSFSDSFRMFL